ncbi:hypothetical protein FSP39_005671 [Pinctada imbricata]|uniref:Uncharacterized protein n=1 Tax=Pinctada imbricata TaxID=66713 RepID=A0AA88XQI8_PINIB|nr:hypothetical protein FSP39_005671 [Pinctada imbricata]
MSESTKKVCLDITEEQFFAIEAFFAHSNWDFEKSIVFNEWRDEVTADINFSEAGRDDSTSEDNERETEVSPSVSLDNVQQRLNFEGRNDSNAVECDKCFCTPCITFYPQKWLGNGCLPHIRNASIRKTKYKKFWTMLSRRDAWKDQRYLEKKMTLFRESADEGIVWTCREVMPECVVSLVRSRYPNPPGRAYMGHKWA